MTNPSAPATRHPATRRAGIAGEQARPCGPLLPRCVDWTDFLTSTISQ